MKKLIIGILAAAMITTAGTSIAFAAKPSHNKAKTFVDADNNGVCDNKKNAICDGTGSGNGNFVDADSNGVCDNKENTVCDGTGNGNGYGNGSGNCQGNGQGQQTGNGHHGRGNR